MRTPAPVRQRLLLIEDDRTTSNALRAILTRLGWDVSCATTLAGALEHFDGSKGNAPPAAVILDLMLPDGDGTRVLELIVQRGLSSRVVVTTGSSDAARLARIQELKPAAILLKPVDFRSLAAGLGEPMV